MKWQLVLLMVTLVAFAMGASTTDEEQSFVEVARRKGGLSLSQAEDGAVRELAQLKRMAVSLKKQLAAKAKADAAKFAKKRAAINKRISARSKKMVAQHKKLKANKPYKGKIGLGNFMYGGPKSKPAKKKDWVTKYQHRIFAAKPGARNLKLRKQIGQRLKKLYKAVKIPEQGFLAEFLRYSGVKKTTAATIRTTWKKAKDWYTKQMFEAYRQQKAARAKAKKAAAERKRLAALKGKKKDTTEYHKLSKAESERLMLINNILEDETLAADEDMSGKETSVEFYGCVDCKSNRKAKVKYSSALDSRERAKELEKRGGKPKSMLKKKAKKGGKKGKGKGKKGIKKGKGGKKASAAQLKAYKKEKAAFMKKITKKLNINNMGLLSHMLERFGIARNAIDVKNFAKEVKTKIRDRLVEAQLKPNEQEELMKAKIEALEMAVAARTGTPVMKKRVRNHYVKPKGRKLPDFSPPKVQKDSKAQLKRDVAISFGSGYLDDAMKTERSDIDNGRTLDEDAQRYSDQLLSEGFTDMEKKPVWEKFDGPGGDHKQQRANKINKHRKRYPNKPLRDGTSPW